jgi:hypothetical protein
MSNPLHQSSSIGLRAAPNASGMVAVLAGNFIVQPLSLLVVPRTMQLGAGAAVLPGVVIHLVLGSLFAFFLLRTRRAPA